MRGVGATVVAFGLLLLAACGDPSVSAPGAAGPTSGIAAAPPCLPPNTGPPTFEPANAAPVSGAAQPGAALPETSSPGTLPSGRCALEIGAHCGFRYLSRPVAGQSWITDEAPADGGDWVPDEWAAIVGPGIGVLDVTVEQIGAATLIVTAGGWSVSYRPVTPSDPEFLCA